MIVFRGIDRKTIMIRSKIMSRIVFLFFLILILLLILIMIVFRGIDRKTIMITSRIMIRIRRKNVLCWPATLNCTPTMRHKYRTCSRRRCAPGSAIGIPGMGRLRSP